jgi:hypothetical protein
VGCLVLDGSDVGEATLQAPVVVPVDPRGGGAPDTRRPVSRHSPSSFDELTVVASVSLGAMLARCRVRWEPAGAASASLAVDKTSSVRVRVAEHEVRREGVERHMRAVGEFLCVIDDGI